MKRCIGRCRIDSKNGDATGRCTKWARPGRLTCHWHNEYEVLPTGGVAGDRMRELEERITSLGFHIIYQDYCECADTPGFPGQIRGVTDRNRQVVRISRVANPKAADLIEILEHELKHIEDPTWDCGNRDVFGRGGPQQRRA